MRNKRKIKPLTFDTHIWNSFVDFLHTEGNFQIVNEGIILRDGVEFLWTFTPNRNPIVSQEIWEDILLNHLLRYKYN